MRIGIDVSLLLYPEVAGMRLVLERLLEAMLPRAPEHEFVLWYHTRRSWGGIRAIERFAGRNVRISAAPLPVRCSLDAVWWLGYHPPLESILSEQVDVFHVGDFLFPRSRTIPLVATLHDLTPELFPELHVLRNRIRHGRQMRWMTRHATRILSVSQASARDFRSLYGDDVPIDVAELAIGSTVTAPQAPDQVASTLRRLGIGDSPFVLCVGTLEPRKNQIALIEAFEALAAERPGLKLVLAGAWGWKTRDLRERIGASTVAHRIVVTGRLPLDDLGALYAAATVFAYPSIAEGFGLPVLEAMRAGVPVVTSSVSSLPEVAGDAALLIDPRAPSDLAAALERLLNDGGLRADLSRRGKERERAFSWERTVDGVLACYARAVARSTANPTGAPGDRMPVARGTRAG